MREIQVSHYTKRIKDKEVLKDINYTFRSGTIYGLYGRRAVRTDTSVLEE